MRDRVLAILPDLYGYFTTLAMVFAVGASTD